MEHSHLTGSHNWHLVALLFLIAVMASYTALDLTRRVTLSRGWARRIWLISGAMAMGVGIWAMHFVAMPAFRLPFAVNYDIGRVINSIIIAFLASRATRSI